MQTGKEAVNHISLTFVQILPQRGWNEGEEERGDEGKCVHTSTYIRTNKYNKGEAVLAIGDGMV